LGSVVERQRIGEGDPFARGQRQILGQRAGHLIGDGDIRRCAGAAVDDDNGVGDRLPFVDESGAGRLLNIEDGRVRHLEGRTAEIVARCCVVGRRDLRPVLHRRAVEIDIIAQDASEGDHAARASGESVDFPHQIRRVVRP
jgi:hypothetical protein